MKRRGSRELAELAAVRAQERAARRLRPKRLGMTEKLHLSLRPELMRRLVQRVLATGMPPQEVIRRLLEKELP